MTNPHSVIAFILRNGGMALGLTAFIDETGTHKGHPITGVAGFLYDKSGVTKFEAQWAKRIAELSEPFHTADCVWGHGQFEGWPQPKRLLLMHDLADIIMQTRLCGFIACVEQTDFIQWVAQQNPEIVKWIGSPYSACLLSCVEMAGIFARKFDKTEEIFYVFESGCDKQLEASAFLDRLSKNTLWKSGLHFLGHGFVSKTSSPTLCSADFLAWEWQRNHVEGQEDTRLNRTGQWRSEFKMLLSTEDSPLFIDYMTQESLNGKVITNAFHMTSF
jgi:hypothetical protein